jgi:hypothetical protein
MATGPTHQTPSSPSDSPRGHAHATQTPCVRPMPGRAQQPEGALPLPQGARAKALGSSVCGTQQPPPFLEPNDIFRYTTKGMCNVTTQYATGSKVAELCPAPGSSEVTPSSNKEASSDIAVHDAMSKKRCKQCPQWVMATTNHDGGNNEKADDSGVGHVVTTTRSSKRQ